MSWISNLWPTTTAPVRPEPMEIRWEDGLPVLHWRGRTIQLDRWWMEAINWSVRPRTWSIYDLAGEEIPLGSEETYRRVETLWRRWMEVEHHQDVDYLDGSGQQVSLHGGRYQGQSRLEYLSLEDTEIMQPPMADVVRIRGACTGIRQITATHYLECEVPDTAEPWTFKAPVIHAILDDDFRVHSQYYDCQVLIVSGHNLGSCIDRVRTSTRHLLVGGRYMVRDRYVRARMAEDLVPPGIPGACLRRGGWLPLDDPPTWWVGIRPPVTEQGESMADRYQIHLSTPLVTVWRLRE